MSIQPDPQEFSVTIRDENLPRTEVVEVLLKLTNSRLTVRDLISERVRAECDKRLFDRAGQLAKRLVQPGPKEQEINGERVAQPDDPERQIALALAAFENNVFVLLLDDRQAESLDEEIEIGDASVVTFLKLTPLVGG